MKAINLFLLSALIGIELILGTIVAPTIFYPKDIIGEGILSHFQSGLMMTHIFIKFGYILLFISFFNFFYECYSFFKNKIKFQIRFSKLILSLLILILSLLFVFYFSDYIAEQQRILGDQVIQNNEFKSMHSASEVVLKIIIIMQIILYFLSFKIEKNTKII
ncbi:DUF4149 domain-containing protein [Campylobacter sp. TTU-622]|uniref:DUF4149 domain-containing protein n=1 Tax=Campylobacter sp. TTU-622 TaxID=2800583 RepID=UPI0019059394|nr:DUF4149 domain-containing protein [Campylobacter sp. TTU-622]MBK1972701.1 DUF4149 domain-containing protein [Campylobacter sp. TTU-622]